jgi:hypothetical protein
LGLIRFFVLTPYIHKNVSSKDIRRIVCSVQIRFYVSRLNDGLRDDDLGEQGTELNFLDQRCGADGYVVKRAEQRDEGSAMRLEVE